jgi:hypothetical protein
MLGHDLLEHLPKRVKQGYRSVCFCYIVCWLLWLPENYRSRVTEGLWVVGSLRAVL